MSSIIDYDSDNSCNFGHCRSDTSDDEEPSMSDYSDEEEDTVNAYPLHFENMKVNEKFIQKRYLTRHFACNGTHQSVTQTIRVYENDNMQRLLEKQWKRLPVELLIPPPSRITDRIITDTEVHSLSEEHSYTTM